MTEFPIIAARLEAAGMALKAKGYAQPYVTISVASYGGFGLTVRPTIYLGSSTNHVRNLHHKTIESALDAIDESVATIAPFSVTEKAREAALSKLDFQERELLGLGLGDVT